MAEVPATAGVVTSQLLTTVAREIAMDIYSLPEILEHNNINQDQWERIKDSPAFRMVLQNEAAAWNSSLNTHERVKLKSSALIESWLPELYARLHDRGESLASKVEGGKLAARLAGMGLTTAETAGAGEKFSVTINLGADHNLKFEKTIQHEPSVGDL